jgi:hypothetical protein
VRVCALVRRISFHIRACIKRREGTEHPLEFRGIDEVSAAIVLGRREVAPLDHAGDGGAIATGELCGTNGKEITLQIHNLAAARISLGVWNGEHARQINTQIADAIDFWLEKDRRQRTLWQPLMRVSERYAQAIREHCVPHDMRALIGLYKDTRAMDIYVWLAYRLPRVPARHDLFIRYDDLKPIFGTGVGELRKFRQVFKRALRAALAWYRDARVGLEPEGIRLFHSPSPVPSDLARSPYGRTIAGGRRRLRLVPPTR